MYTLIQSAPWSSCSRAALARLDRAVNDLDALGQSQLGRVVFQRVPSGSRDRARGDQQARAGNKAAVNGLLDADIAIAGSLGLDISQRRKTLLQGTAYGNRRARRSQRSRILQDVDVVSPFGGVFSLQKNVGVGVDQAGKNGSFRKINDGGAGWNLRAGGVGNAVDAVPADDDDLLAPRRV